MSTVKPWSFGELLPSIRDQLTRLVLLMEKRSVMLSAHEIEELTGYKQAGAQLAELKAQGFHRARRNAAGHVVLERPHFEAVCRGTFGVAMGADAPTPRLRPIREPKLDLSDAPKKKR